MRLKVKEYEGDLLLKPGAVIEPENHTAIVRGEVVGEGDVKVEGRLKARSVRCKKLVADGLEADRVVCDHLLAKEVSAKEVIVKDALGEVLTANRLVSRGPIKVKHLSAVQAEVGGSLESITLEADTLNVRGSLRALKAKVRRAEVKGSLAVEELSSDVLKVDGSAELGDGSYVKSCLVRGTLRVSGNVRLDECFSSIVRVSGNLYAKTLKVKDALRVIGSLKAEKLVVNYLRVDGSLKASSLEALGGGKGLLEGDVVNIYGRADRVSGRVVNLVKASVNEVQGEVVKLEGSRAKLVKGVEVEVKDSIVDRVEAERAYIISGRVKELVAESYLVGERAKVDRAPSPRN